jgi:hypothetical protein
VTRPARIHDERCFTAVLLGDGVPDGFRAIEHEGAILATRTWPEPQALRSAGGKGRRSATVEGARGTVPRGNRLEVAGDHPKETDQPRGSGMDLA